MPSSYQESQDAVISSHQPSAEIRSLRADGVELDTIVAAVYQNHTQSSLVRLPDELIVAIMERVDHHDVLRLRQVSRDFMRLFSQSFRKYHLIDAHDRESALCWPGSGPRLWIGSQASISEPMISAPYMPPVRNLGRKGDAGTTGNSLKACHSSTARDATWKHRTFYFSARQRHEANDDERICKAHEGCLKLCGHISARWDTAQRFADAPPGQNVVQCDEGHHKVSPCQHVRDGTSKLCCSDDKPRFKSFRDEGQNLCFELSFSTHLPFRPPGPEPGSKVSAMAFRASIAKLVREGLSQSLFHWAGSNLRGWDMKTCFDANICSCLDWGQLTPTDASDFSGGSVPTPRGLGFAS